jgi:hypothetical protein
MPRRIPLIGTLFAVCLLAAGCGDKSKSPEVVVRGQILYRGEPLSGGMIVFSPNAERGMNGPLLIATLQADGTFILLGTDGKPVQPGWYRIAVAPRAGTTDLPTAEQPYPGLAARYRNPSQSGLEREIKAGEENLVCFDLDDS